MNEVIASMMKRRTVRNYTDARVPIDILQSILEAASYSPNAGNRQTTQIVVSTNEEINNMMGKIHRVLSKKYNAAKTKEAILLEDGDLEQYGLESAFHHAPTVLTLFGPKFFRFTEADCYIMADSICLAAYAYGVSSCIIGGVVDIFQNEYGKKLLENWGISEKYSVCLHITLGYAFGLLPDPKPRTYPKTIFVK
jgi:nitroreductase